MVEITSEISVEVPKTDGNGSNTKQDIYYCQCTLWTLYLTTEILSNLCS